MWPGVWGIFQQYGSIFRQEMSRNERKQFKNTTICKCSSGVSFMAQQIDSLGEELFSMI
jgi:hypothetical protein